MLYDADTRLPRDDYSGGGVKWRPLIDIYMIITTISTIRVTYLTKSSWEATCPVLVPFNEVNGLPSQPSSLGGLR